uniref:Uncharacterized protein n=1 Tax=Candidatus Kentrum sp. FM TaxID=2126340 RepID=A0A450SAE8_9GAMM|nr:MAG: hypothetical protein BECKFM1743C_GA0114222_1002511 [Candidatus Kentron sp. FM]VFJ49077.1 MAG: hypothetical protein BECKFM1743A_GA0114220_1006610 [Candidatus Kentron sp. FM]VFK06777.1 MAG: hypothetical protein BECKFM1743B_GA0114221_1002411 [Candidatus Kentron sp. FM]
MRKSIDVIERWLCVGIHSVCSNNLWLLLDSGLMADLCNYTSEIDMDARMLGANTGGEHWGRTQGSPVRSPERTGESCIRPYAQKLWLARAVIRIASINPESDKSLCLFPARLY